jgi:hypothetical protein
VAMVEVFIAPREEDLQHAMEVCQGRSAVDQQPAPDERTAVAQDAAQLRNVWGGAAVACPERTMLSPRLQGLPPVFSTLLDMGYC